MARLSTDWIGPNALGYRVPLFFLACSCREKMPVNDASRCSSERRLADRGAAFSMAKARIFGGTRTAGRHINIS